MVFSFLLLSAGRLGACAGVTRTKYHVVSRFRCKQACFQNSSMHIAAARSKGLLAADCFLFPSDKMTEREVVSLDSDSDSNDENLRHAIALSLQDYKHMASKDTATINDTTGRQTPQVTNRVAFGSISLDRKKMEQERLKRLGKRPRDSNEKIPDEHLAKRSALQRPTPSEGDPQPRYLHGAVRRTWTRGYAKTSDDITIEEILEKDKLQLALLSSFQWDEEWLVSKLNVDRTKIFLLAFAANEEQKQLMRDAAPTNIRFCFPPMHGPGSMHSKLQLLKFPNHLRLVMPTGNLVPYDWGETGVLENMVFLIDLPRLHSDSTQEETPFKENLCYFLKASGVGDSMVNSLGHYDFAATKRLGFVCTIPGSHAGEGLPRVGYCGLGNTVKGLGLATDTPIEVDLACASLGSINCSLVNSIYNACQGDDGRKEYHLRVNRKDKDSRPSEQLRDRFRIYFPSKRTIAQSKGGRKAAGTICVQAKWWRAPTFPCELVYDCINNRTGLLMHSKMIYVRFTTEKETNHLGAAGWAYVGSANLSESAWGRLVKDRSTGVFKMNCRNWECGVIVPAQSSLGSDKSMAMFSGSVPVPMEMPGRPYGPNDQPWFFSEDL